jgi:hypothetical protein
LNAVVCVEAYETPVPDDRNSGAPGNSAKAIRLRL